MALSQWPLSRNASLGALGALVALLAMSLFTVDETQTALRFQLGEIVQWREGELVNGFLHGPVLRMACRPDGSGVRETECTFYKHGRAQ